MLESSLATTGDEFDGLAMLGQVLAESGQSILAYEHLTLAIGDATHFPTVEEVSASGSGMLPYAEARAIAFARAARAVALAQLGQFARALQESEAAVSALAQRGLVLLDAAEVFRLNGDDDRCSKTLTQALEAPQLGLMPRHAIAARQFLAGVHGQLF